MKYLDQDEILAMLKVSGVAISRDQLQEFLDKNHDLDGVRIRPRGRGIDRTPKSGRPHESRWYDILAPKLATSEADRLVVDHIVKHEIFGPTKR